MDSIVRKPDNVWKLHCETEIVLNTIFSSGKCVRNPTMYKVVFYFFLNPDYVYAICIFTAEPNQTLYPVKNFLWQFWLRMKFWFLTPVLVQALQPVPIPHLNNFDYVLIFHLETGTFSNPIPKRNTTVKKTWLCMIL